MSGRILIADDLVTDRIALKARLALARYDVVLARTMAEVVTHVEAGVPDVILLDLGFPGGGLAACRHLRALAPLADVPIVIYGARNDRDARIEALKAGADEVLAGLPAEVELSALLRSILRDMSMRGDLLRRRDVLGLAGFSEPDAGFAPRIRAAIVTPQANAAVIWRRALAESLGGDVVAETADVALEPKPVRAPDAYVIVETPAHPGSSLRLVSELRARQASRDAVILYQMFEGASATADLALDFGANAIVPGPFDAAELALRLDRLVTRKREADRMRDALEDRLDQALRDPLTGLYNRRYADGYLDRLCRTQGAGRPDSFALMLLDLDHFKGVNDRFGHLAGDAVLRSVASRLRAELRDCDMVARVGGEEFLVVLPDTDSETARAVAERLRAAVVSRDVALGAEGRSVAISISVGVAVARVATLDGRSAYERADQALYASKAAGRNLVTFAATRNAA
ncbi:diguanylate cyclase [Maritimibacter sp. DP1N21-5]|uniref:diguanylate cyclase n=1 Tax=Maritimibacter sp. DP1N21-5 TaxID=2836867 RepID=UPI001C464E43|nr:diguanylate cyclase [Maritimibacter sp. DP1N21-5]MBV7409228.1 diguanylate cyclase [Maritimibacter sp. DP1N21-5]